MRSSVLNRLSFEGYWTDTSQDSIKTRINYNLLTYGQLVKIRAQGISTDDVLNRVSSIENVYVEEEFNSEVKSVLIIEDFIKNLESDDYNLLCEEMISDSTLSKVEFRKLEFIVYYLNWKADEHTRRINYNCNDCRKYDYLSGRYCYLEQDEFDLPIYEVNELGSGEYKVTEVGSKNKTYEDLLEDVDLLSLRHNDFSSFEIWLHYFSSMEDLDRPGRRIEVCPEALKIKVESLAELFEMEARASEYHVLPFSGSQIEQPSLVIEAFDAVRAGRNLFHSKKMKDILGKKKGG